MFVKSFSVSKYVFNKEHDDYRTMNNRLTYCPLYKIYGARLFCVCVCVCVCGRGWGGEGAVVSGAF